MKNYFLFILVLFSAINSTAQDFDKRHSFAKSYYGVDLNLVPRYGTSQFIDADGNTIDFERNSYLNPAINIGATHFWGYADIYVSITTGNIKLNNGDDGETIEHNTDFGVFTGTRIYPFALTKSKLRPFVGYKFSPFRYEQENNDGIKSKKTQVKSVFDVGLGYQTANLYLYAGYNRLLNPNLDLYISRNQEIAINFPNHFFNAGVNFMLETTKGTNNPVNNHFNEVFSQSNNDGFFIGIGPSSAFPIRDSEYLSEYYPFLDDRTMPIIFPDLSIGYHFTKHDVLTTLAFRPMTQRRNTQNFNQKINRNSLVLEAYKIVGDYHGFSPFIGLGVSYEALKLVEEDNGIEITNITQNKMTPIITTGWDIRPSKKGDFWLLRTNLRYAPILGIEHNDKILSLQHLEFNFIQFVLYTQRRKAFKNYNPQNN